MQDNITSDFLEWKDIFLLYLRNPKDLEYLGYESEFLDYLFAILSENELPEPHTQFTELFLNSIIYQVVSAVINIEPIDQVEVETNLCLLSTVLNVCTWGVQHEKMALYEIPKNILYKHSRFYRTAKELTNEDVWQNLIDIFLSSGDTNIMLEAVSQNPNFPKIIFLLEIVSLFINQSITTYFIEEAFKVIIESLGNCLKLMMDIKTIKSMDTRDFENLFYLFFINLSCSEIECLEGLQTIYQFMYFCLKSEVFGIQLFIIKIFNQCSTINNFQMNEFFLNWCEQNNFFEFLIGKDFHEEIILQFPPIFKILGNRKQLKDRILLSLWDRAQHAHLSLRGHYVSLIIKIVEFSTNEDDFKFIEETVNHSLSIGVNNEVILLLQGCSELTTQNISHFAVTTLFNHAPNNKNIENALRSVISDRMIGSSRMILCKMCLEYIKNHKNHDIVTTFLPKIFYTFHNSSALSEDLENSLYETLPYDRQLIFELLGRYYIVNKRVLVLSQIEQLSDILDDGFWNFLRTLFENLGTNSTTEEGFSQILKLINKYNFESSSISFAYFIKSFLLILNLKDHKILSHETQRIELNYQFISPPNGTDLLLKILQKANNDYVVNIIENTILDFVTNFSRYETSDAIQVINSLILPQIFNHTSDQYEYFEVKRLLKLLFSILLHFESSVPLEDFGFHKHSNYKENTICLCITGKIIQNYKIICHSNDTKNSISKRLKQVFPNLPDHLYFSHKSSYLDHDNSLSFYNFNEHEEIELSAYEDKENCNKKVELPIYPSCFLNNNCFQDYLLQISNSKETIDFITKFLNYLPNNEKHRNMALDPDQISSIISGSESNSFLNKYLLQVLICEIKIGDYEQIIEEFQFSNFVTFLIQNLNKLSNSIYEILTLIKYMIDREDLETFNSIFNLVSKVLNQNESKEFDCDFETVIVASQLFSVLFSTFCKSEIKSEYLDELEKIILNSNEVTWTYLRSGFLAISNPIIIFDRLLKRINNIAETNNSEFFADLFAAYAPKVSNNFEVSEILEKCINLAINESGPILSSLCEVAVSILDSNKEINITQFIDILPQILHKAFLAQDDKQQKSLLDLCSTLADHSEYARNVMNKYLKPFFNIATNEWNYDPSNFRKSDCGFLGLTNLGATCYMNSVFQQLFHYIPFRNAVFNETFDELPDLQEFQKIFALLAYSNKAFVNTEEFCRLWKGWNKIPINTHQQQDAEEFLNFFFNQLPDSLKLFYKGTIINHIEGISEEFHSSNIEEFYSFSLDIKNFTSIDESFNAFLEEELFTGENQIIADDIGHKIDAKKYSKIKDAPSSLILHLKRFEYDFHTCNRIKITSRFVIPQTLDISRILEPSENNMNSINSNVDSNNHLNNENSTDAKLYYLKGVIMHIGNANGGHYTSLIKINDKWYLFNDKKIIPFDFSKFETETFGGKSNSNCAFLLFYVDKQNHENENIFVLDGDIKRLIDKENEEFLQRQALFSNSTLYFASHCKETEIMSDYFFNIFAHSSLNDAHVISERLKESIAQSSQSEWFISYLISNFSDKIVNLFSYCTNETILASLNDIIQSTFPYFKNKNSYDLVFDYTEKIIDFIKVSNQLIDKENQFSSISLLSIWRNYKYLYEIPYQFLRFFHTSIESWCEIVTTHILNFYKETKSDIVIEKVDFSCAFKILKRVLSIGKKSPVMQFLNEIVKSESNTISFLSFALKTNQDFNIERSLEMFTCGHILYNNNEKFIKYCIDIISSTDFNVSYYLLDEKHSYNYDQIIAKYSKEIHKNNFTLRKRLISDYDQYILPLLLYKELHGIRNSSLKLTKLLFMKNLTDDQFRQFININSFDVMNNPLLEDHIDLRSESKDEILIIFRKLLNNAAIIANNPRSFYCSIELADQRSSKFSSTLLQFVQTIQWILLIINIYDKDDFLILNNLFERCQTLQIYRDEAMKTLANTLLLYQTNDSTYKARYLKYIIMSMPTDDYFYEYNHDLKLINLLNDEELSHLVFDEQFMNIIKNFFENKHKLNNINDVNPLVTKIINCCPKRLSDFEAYFNKDKMSLYKRQIISLLGIRTEILPLGALSQCLNEIIRFFYIKRITSSQFSMDLQCFHLLNILPSILIHLRKLISLVGTEIEKDHNNEVETKDEDSKEENNKEENSKEDDNNEVETKDEDNKEEDNKEEDNKEENSKEDDNTEVETKDEDNKEENSKEDDNNEVETKDEDNKDEDNKEEDNKEENSKEDDNTEVETKDEDNKEENSKEDDNNEVETKDEDNKEEETIENHETEDKLDNKLLLSQKESIQPMEAQMTNVQLLKKYKEYLAFIFHNLNHQHIEHFIEVSADIYSPDHFGYVNELIFYLCRDPEIRLYYLRFARKFVHRCFEYESSSILIAENYLNIIDNYSNPEEKSTELTFVIHSLLEVQLLRNNNILPFFARVLEKWDNLDEIMEFAANIGSRFDVFIDKNLEDFSKFIIKLIGKEKALELFGLLEASIEVGKIYLYGYFKAQLHFVTLIGENYPELVETMKENLNLPEKKINNFIDDRFDAVFYPVETINP